MATGRTTPDQRVGIVSILALALALLAPGVSAQEPAAQQKFGEDPFSVMMKWRPSRDAPDMPDFVKQTRPSDDRLGYTPVTGEHPARPAAKNARGTGSDLGQAQFGRRRQPGASCERLQGRQTGR